jgi:hypothetical protein
MFVAPIAAVRCLLEQLALHVHDRLMPRKRERALVPIDSYHLMAVVADKMNLRPNEGRTDAMRLVMVLLLSSYAIRVEPQTTPGHEQHTPSAEG